MKKSFLIVYHNLIRNLKSPFLLIISIAFSMVLMITAFVSVGSFVIYREQLNSNAQSDYDLVVFDVNYEKYTDLKLDDEIEDLSVVKNLGYVNLGNNYFNAKEYMYLQEMDSDTFLNEGFSLTSGRIPSNSTEILVPYEYAQLYSKKVGDTVLFNLGLIKENGYYIHEKNDRTKFKTIGKNLEFVSDEEVIYTIVGIYETCNSLYVNNTELSHYYAYSYLNPGTIKKDDLVDVLFKFKETSGISSYADKYSSKLQATKIGGEYSNAWKFKTTNLFSSDYKLTIYILTLLLVFAISYLAIKSALEYGNTDTKKFYTRLMSIGATSKDIKNAWDLQTILISLLAIPLGICVALLLIDLVVALPLKLGNIDVVINGMLSSKMILISIAILLVVILLANHNSEENTLYLIPLESIKGDTESITTKYVRYNDFTKLRGEIDKYVKNNFSLKRNTLSQSFVFTFALSISFVMMFLTINLFTTKPLLDYFKEKPTYLTLTLEGNEDYLNELKNISNIPEVSDYSIQRNIDFLAYTKKPNTFRSSIGDIFSVVDTSQIRMPVNIISVSDEEFTGYFSTIASNGNLEEVSKNYNMIISSTFLSEKDKSYISDEVMEVGNVGSDYVIYYTDLEGNEKELARLDKFIVLDIDNTNVSFRSGYQNILVKDSYLETLIGEGNTLPHKTINVKVTDKVVFLDRINSYLEGKENLIINAKDRNVDSITDSIYIKISYLSTFIIVAVGLLLLFLILYESIGTYTKSRTKELGLLKSMGVNGKKLESIIHKEFGRSFIISLVLGAILGVVLHLLLLYLFSIDSIEYVNSVFVELIGFLALMIVLAIFFLISISLNTKDLKRKYPIELMKDNFREF